MNIEIIGKIIILGYVILASAIILNVIANAINIATWYELIENIMQKGIIDAITKQKIISTIFQFIIYPAILGVVAYNALILLKIK
jgi:hypothetical protein